MSRAVPSVADHFSRELHKTLARLTAEERIELALRLGDEAGALYRSAQGLDPVTALPESARALWKRLTSS